MSTPSESDPGTRVVPEGERRQLTMMFCDLVGSTAYSERLDPEDLRDLLREYQSICAAVLEDHGGTVAQYIGDGLLVYFGYPVASEDDPRRAVRAGVALVDAVSRPAEGHKVLGTVRLEIRVGIHTGLVVIGEMGRGRRIEPESVVGEAPNLAARLQALAGPGEVLVSDATERLIRGFFDLEALGPQSLKGISRPVPVFRVAGATSARTRLDVVSRSPLRGRDRDLELLGAKFAEAKAGGQPVVGVFADPGVGKSRILLELRASLGADSHSWLEGHCFGYRAHTPFFPFADLLQRSFDLAADRRPQANVELLDERLVRAVGADAAAGLADDLAPLLGVPPEASVTAVQLRRRLAAALARWLQCHASGRPVVLVVEDVHWADASSLDVLDRLLAEARSRVLVIVTWRTGSNPAIQNRTGVELLELRALDDEQMRGIVTATAGAQSIPSEALAGILARAEGVPLFAEELTRAVIESDGGRDVATSSVPASLHDSLLARLDRLGDAKETAQLAAVFGRRFSSDLLGELAGLGLQDINQRLQLLLDAELIVEESAPGGSTYSFRHALLREAAYESLLRRTRRESHSRIADLLVSERPGVGDDEPEILAQHYAAAERTREAFDAWVRASARAGLRVAYSESRGHLEEALSLVPLLPPSPEVDRLEEYSLISLAVTLMRTQGHATDIGTALSRAGDLALARGSRVSRRRIQSMVIPHLQAVGRYNDALAEAERALELSEQPGMESFLPNALGLLGSTLIWRGDFVLGSEMQARCRDAYLRTGDPTPAVLGGLIRDLQFVASTALGGLACWLLGDELQSAAWVGEAEAMSADIGDPDVQILVLLVQMSIQQLRHDLDALGNAAERCMRLARDIGYEHRFLCASVFFGWLESQHGNSGSGIPRMRSAIDGLLTEIGEVQMTTAFNGMLGSALEQTGQFDAATTTIEQAIATAGATGERYYESELHRLLARVRASAGNVASARMSLQQAIDVARAQGAAWLEHRALDLAPEIGVTIR